MAAKKRGLGRGLNALLSGAGAQQARAQAGAVAPENTDTPLTHDDVLEGVDGKLRQMPIDLVQRGKYQPRRDMHPDALEELAESIKSQGVIQPIVVRAIASDKYEIIAGERRWRAAQLAGLQEVPALIRDVPDEAAIAMALIENIQRENLNAMEEALALSRLQQEFELTQQGVAEAVGKSRATVANLLRLLSLREEVQRMLEHGDLEMGHARALLGLPVERQFQAANTVVGKGLSVRQTEALVRSLLSETNQQKKPTSKNIDPDIKKLQNDLSEKVGSPVLIQHSSKGKGKLIINYNNLDELDGVLKHIR